MIGDYRWCQSLLPAEPEYAAIEARLQTAPTITVPTIAVDGAHDPLPRQATAAATGFLHRRLPAPDRRRRPQRPQEALRAFARALLDAGHL